ncbi:type IV conjugative transfer system protein TraL [Thioalkalivibrio thiocyanodenitrificans]|uniref:type IV conjugative transfer system protein TraL n=1 Tax=Thioalkalivibrio thiocyanodenitrificans TaxID=243063 RepID=UPI000368F800|nr:type IV conjugative transfer system protein TraL [Thioalkalivibrio thiocyanodenitrificans]
MAFDPQAHLIGKGIDRPTPILFWEPVEFVISICMLGFGIVMGILLFGAVGAVAVLVGAQKLKRGAKPGTVQHFLWRLGLQLDSCLKKKFPAPWKNEFIQ